MCGCSEKSGFPFRPKVIELVRITAKKSKPMKPSAVLERSRERIRALALEYGVSNPRVFGSVLRNEDSESSDLDILVDPAPTTSLLDIAKLQMRLESELGIHVDVLTPRALPLSFRNHVVNHAQPV
jgi:predicted nucleotidyltransferase